MTICSGKNQSNAPADSLQGVTTLTAGIVLLPLPGPGVVIIPIGLGMLAKEYAWARKLNTWFKEKIQPA
jgi:uncharacterized protein (TIGR02611 family)